MGMKIETKFSINEQERKGESCVYVLIESGMQKPGLAINQPEAVSIVAKSVSTCSFFYLCDRFFSYDRKSVF